MHFTGEGGIIGAKEMSSNTSVVDSKGAESDASRTHPVGDGRVSDSESCDAPISPARTIVIARPGWPGRLRGDSSLRANSVRESDRLVPITGLVALACIGRMGPATACIGESEGTAGATKLANTRTASLGRAQPAARSAGTSR